MVAKNLVRGIEVNCSSPMICEDFERKLGELPNTRELVLTEAALPLCYQHVEGVWDICDIVISRHCLFEEKMAIRQTLMLELSDIVGPENVDDMTKCVLGVSPKW